MKRLILVGLCVLGVAILGSKAHAATYLGSQTCLGCHTDKASWANTFHTKKVLPMTDANIICDANQNGSNDFIDGLTLDGSHGFDSKWAPMANAGVAPMLVFSSNQYFVTIGDNDYEVSYVLGGAGWKQRYMTRIGNSLYILPIQYDKETRQWVTYDPNRWYTYAADGTTVTGALYGPQATPVSMGKQGDSWQKRCMGCHTTGLTTVTANASGEYLGEAGNQFKEFNIGCEACHGPGSDHIANINNSDKKILNPARLDLNRANEVCGACHGRGHSKPNKTYGYPWKDDTNTAWVPGGKRVREFYTDEGTYWPDGWTSKSHHQQWLDFSRGGHNQAGLKCFSCHDPHSNASGEHQLYLRSDNNSLCVSCHQEFSTEAATIAHTFHPYDPDGPNATSRCTKCHMPKVAKSAVEYDISAHSFEVPLPSRTLFYQSSGGMPNACGLCHRNNEHGEGAVDANIAKWNEVSDVTIATWADQRVQAWWGGQEPIKILNYSIDFQEASQSVSNPAAVTVHAHGGDTGTLLYKFWQGSGYGIPGGNITWTVIKDYSPVNTATWTPPATGDYVVVIWVADDTSVTSEQVHQTGGVVKIE